jgi:hypothetical protein
MTTTLTAYSSISKDIGKWQGITGKAPDVAQQTKYYQANIAKVKTIDDFLKNARLFNYAMTAFGLADKIDAKGLMRKVLQQGVSGSSALANKLNDPRIKAFASAFDFAAHGEGATSTTETQINVVSRYTEQKLEENQGKQNPGVQLALYFRRQAPSVTSVYAILADKKLLTVAQTALGISPLTSAQNIDVQARALGAKLKLSDFQDPKKLEAFIARFAARYDAIAASNSDALQDSSSNPNFASQGAGINAQLLLTLQGLKHRG